jgi:hypothetical protein
MPLFPVSTYSSWQLACIAAAEPLDPAHPEHVQSDEAIRAELRTRQIADSDVEEMIGLARRIGKRITPVVCMDVDDLQLGIDTQFDAGEIEATARDQLIAFVAVHADLPREHRQPRSAKRRAHWTETLVMAYFVVGLILWAVSARSGLGFVAWLIGMFAVIWIQQSWPSWRLRWRRPRAG